MDLKQMKKILNSKSELVFKKLGMECECFGDNIYSTCPVHEDSDNPRAFSFCQSRGMWKCWTRDCQNHYNNDIFGLIRGVLSTQNGADVEFKDVLKWIYKEFNIKSTGSTSKVEVAEEPEDEFYRIIKSLRHEQNEHCEHEIKNIYSCDDPSEYFIGRGFKKSTMKYFGVGDCYEKGIMKERAVIPIHGTDGSKLVGVIGRSIKEYKMPKFLLYPKGFEKRNYFYNYHRALPTAQETKCLYILEGQGDVWKLHESGVKNAVSVFGKTISKQQEEQMKKLSITHLVILMDNDQAGREARIQMQRQFGRMYKLTFPRLTDKDIGDMTTYKIKKDILNNLRGTY